MGRAGPGGGGGGPVGRAGVGPDTPAHPDLATQPAPARRVPVHGWVLCAPAGAALSAGRVVARGATLRALRAAWLDAGRPRVGQVGGPGSNWAVLDGQSTAEGWAVALVAQTDLVVVDGVVWDRDEAEWAGLSGMTATATGLVMATGCGGVA